VSFGYNPPPWTGNLNVWATNLITYLQRTASRLGFKSADARATENGVILWDDVNGYPVISKDGVWRQIILEDGNASLYIPSNVTAAAANTAYALTFTVGVANGISLGTPASRIVFDEGGEYMLAFTAQITSTNSSQVNFWFWPRINGVDIPTSAMRTSLSSNGATDIVARSAIFSLSAGDYLEAYWAVDNTNASLSAHAATAFAPSTPAATLAITRIHG
jgi:hypothetical protein